MASKPRWEMAGMPNESVRMAIWWALVSISLAPLLLASAGCHRPAAPTTSSGPQLYKPALDRDRVVIELAVAEVPLIQDALWENLIQQVDRQALDLPTRRRLDANGIEAGTLLTQLPPALFQMLHDKVESDDGVLVSGTLVDHQQIHTRQRQTHWIQTAVDQSRVHWTLVEGDFHTSGSAAEASAGFSISSEPMANGRVRIAITPEIRYGEKRPRIGLADREFRLEESRKQRDFVSLQFELELRTGHTVLVWGLEEPGLGELLFRTAEHSRRFLIVRLVQTQLDNLFAPRQTGLNLAQ